ncbi:TetM/TetW/TetO/TetS family tetracycline resistance ribosomal protection protein [Actinoallomurus sp. NBC_01490]|uniref:translation factor GTPase family protein n=1 Tax=Actinoallomurus sp. NBC_01490 TaxID=2903557 RepID=UPI002E2EDA44|nr:translation factor GTPase family protein [Actinoallomurus sp. NBC_01490]
MTTLNLGILAHVDAGKTSLTERLLYAAGVIDAVGSVDDGNTQTDSSALERRRGITIKSAVVSFRLGDVTVNLIDTPGHPDFIAEVERVLGVLDGAVLVVSAVEGVQAQTRILMRTLRRLRIPTLIFANKIDRRGARSDGLLRALAERLTPAVVAMGAVRGLGTRDAAFTPYGPGDEDFRAALADLLTRHDDDLLTAYVEDALTYPRLRDALAAQVRQGRAHPVFFGSAITGTGLDALTAGIRELLPRAGDDADGPVSGTVFKIERGAAGEKVACARLFSGTVRVRDALRFGDAGEAKVTGISVFDGGAAVPRGRAGPGDIVRLRGLGGVRIGDSLGEPPSGDATGHFAPPTLETVVVPRRRSDRGALHAALTELAEQDPLIGLRQDDLGQEISVSLYGEVQKEVIQATLADDFGLDVEFRETTTLHVERPAGTGEAVEVGQKDGNPFLATIGLRVDPAPAGSGTRFRLEVELGCLPYAFFAAVEETTHATLRRGPRGWQVTDCTVTMTRAGYFPPVSTAADFRGLTPRVLRAALRRAGTVVCEPLQRFHLEVPEDTYGGLAPVLGRLRAVPRTTEVHGTVRTVEGEIPAARVHELERRLPGLTRGEGLLECTFDRYAPVHGEAPGRPR